MLVGRAVAGSMRETKQRRDTRKVLPSLILVEILVENRTEFDCVLGIVVNKKKMEQTQNDDDSFSR